MQRFLNFTEAHYLLVLKICSQTHTKKSQKQEILNQRYDKKENKLNNYFNFTVKLRKLWHDLLPRVYCIPGYQPLLQSYVTNLLTEL
jgi:hypothetical protein